MGVLISLLSSIIIFLIKCTFYTEVVHFIGKNVLKIKNEKFESKLIWQHFAIAFIIALIVEYLLAAVGIRLPFSPCLVVPFILYHLLISQIKLTKKNVIILAVAYFAVSILIAIIMQHLGLSYLKSQILN